jgi:membrane-associated protein
MEAIMHIALAIAGSPWAYVALAALLIVDGFFPFVPGETLVVTLAVLSATADGPNLWIVLGVAIVASTLGDAIAFAIGRRVGVSKRNWMRRRRVAAALAWAHRGFATRPATLMLTAKFVPVARVAVTVTAGATGFPVRRYLALALTASSIYTAFHVAVGVAAGSWLASSPLLAVAVGMVGVFALGFLIDTIVRRLARVRAVQVPVTRDSRKPLFVTDRDEREARDHALASLGIPIEDVDGQVFASADRPRRLRELARLRIPQRTLPEADVVRWNVKIAGQPVEPVNGRPLDVGGESPGVEAPAVQDGETLSDIAQRDREIDGLCAYVGASVSRF